MKAHDKIVKTVLSDVKLAKRFMRFHLPLALKKDINLETLKIEKGTFVDRRLCEHLSDLLYSVNVKGKKSYIYLLLESQSTVDPLMAFRLLQYTVQIMQQHLKSNKNSKQLPLVYPMVYYTGQPSKKGFTRDITDCFENPKLAKEYFLKPFKLIDLNTFSDDDLLKDKLLSGLQLIQKHIYERDLSLVLDKMLAQDVFVLMHQFDDNGDYLQSMLRYIYHKVEARKPENQKTLFVSYNSKYRRIVPP
jgi:predicted transposase/invertase (TIGR01784 family)